MMFSEVNSSSVMSLVPYVMYYIYGAGVSRKLAFYFKSQSKHCEKITNISHISQFENFFENHILHVSLCFSCLKISKKIINFENESISSNVLSTIQLICITLLL